MPVGEGPYIPHIFGQEVQDLLRQSRGWLSAAVHHSIPWPEKDVLIHYDGYDYFLRGLKQQEDNPSSACINVRFTKEENLNATLKRIYTFTSILGWFLRGYADVTGYIYGSHPTLYSAGRQPFGTTIAGGPHGFNCNFMPIIRDDNIRKALAYWREGLRLEHIHEPYSFLSFYKVIESQFNKGKARGAWINTAIPTLTDKAAERVQKLQYDNIDVGRHIYESGRCAVAHASIKGPLVDPDIPEDRIRISHDLVLIRALAKKLIREELKVPDEMDVHKYRDALAHLYQYLDQAHIDTLHAGNSVIRKRIGLNGVRISVSHWPNHPPKELEGLILSVNSAHDGILRLSAINDSQSLVLGFIFDFTDQKAHTDLESSGVQAIEDGGKPSEMIALLEYQKSVIGNGIIEIQLPNNEKVVCEIVIPVNIDLGGTFDAIDQRIEEIKRQTYSEGESF